jgi:hypothetical protein
VLKRASSEMCPRLAPVAGSEAGCECGSCGIRKDLHGQAYSMSSFQHIYKLLEGRVILNYISDTVFEFITNAIIQIRGRSIVDLASPNIRL